LADQASAWDLIFEDGSFTLGLCYRSHYESPQMKAAITIELPIPAGLAGFKLPAGVKRRLTVLLDRQDAGIPLTPAERHEAEWLVEMAEFLSLFKLRASRTA
jgi:hypothetical protein